MAPKLKVLLLGATGETGGDVLNGLIEDGELDVALLVQPSSAEKPAVQAFAARGFEMVIADINGDVEDLARAIAGFDTVISTIGPTAQKSQLALVDAAAKAGTRRFVPCGFMTVCPPGGIMQLRDDKEEVYQRIWQHRLPHTIIDVGYWHQISVPRVPTGKADYAIIYPRNELVGKGDARTLLTDKRDMGRFVARIIRDDRTLNQKVITYSDFISENDIVGIVEEKSGEKVEVTHQDLVARLAEVRAEHEREPSDNMKRLARFKEEYSVSKYVRHDNTLENASYLGYVDARALYPDFRPITMDEYVGELLAGKGQRPYAGRYQDLRLT